MAVKGVLYMIPCPISDQTAPFDVVPETNRAIIDSLDYFIVENVRSARRFLSKCHLTRKIDDMEFVELNEHTPLGRDVELMIKPMLEGRSAGVISEAGVPGIADPGAAVVEMCHRNGIRVIPLIGPSSILLAMMASGLNGQAFAFNGYLPVKPLDRAKSIKQIERRAKSENQAQIFIEAPYRNVKLAEQLFQVCSEQTRLVIACDITAPDEYIRMQTISQWRREGIPNIVKRPTIFIIG